MGWFSKLFGGSANPPQSGSVKRNMLPFDEQPECWQMAVTLYQEKRMKVVPRGWSKQNAYPVFDGFRAMSADEIFDLVQRIDEVQQSGKNVEVVVKEIEDEVRQIANQATGDCVRPG